MSELNLEKRGRDFIGVIYGCVVSIVREAGEFVARIDGETVGCGHLSECYGAVHARVYGS